ncbi:uncharacterized protein LOC129585456 isoform X2 [Paramacrobiotus metropolitanus]|nr:uncharacterized protein LOC129585456 isoform X2 [Paramacrobiotus metropolitanus]
MEVLLEICQLEEGRGDVADDICGDSTAVGTGGRKRNHEAPVQPKTIARALKERNFSRLYCPDCDVFLDKACPVHSQRVCDAPVIPLAIASLPSVLEFISFGISGLPTGVQAKSAIPKLTVFGPLRGVIAHDLEKKDSLSTTWSGQENEPVYALPDLNGDCVRRIKMDSVHTCNWLKFVRRAADAREHNLAVYETNGEIYFLTIRPLAPGEELKFWYSQKYAQSIGLCDSVPDPHDKARVVPPKFKKIYSFESTLPANLPDDDDNSGAFVEEFLGDGGSGIESSDSADLAPTTSRNSEWIDEKDKDEDVSMEADQEEEKDVPHNPPGEGGRPIKSRHKWSREETTAALRLYIAYGGCGLESRDTANRDTLWQNIYNDLIAARFKITSVRAVRERMLNVMKKFQTDMSNEKDIVLDSVGELLREIFQLRKESRRQLKINKNPEAGEEAETITQHSPDQINVKKCRHRWSKEETLAALQLYCTHEGYRVGANRAGLWQRIYDGLIGANFRIISPRAVREHVFKLMASSQTDDEGTALDATGEMLRKIRQLEKDSENEAANKKQQRLEKMNASAAASTSGPKKRRFYPKPRTMLPPTETVYPCLECLVSFTSEKLLEIHNLGHNTADTAKWDQSDGIVCPECQKTFESIVSLIAHIMEHKKVYAPRVQCAQCHRYIAAQFLARHMREMHPSEAGTTSNVCDECGEEFPTPRRLAFHIKGMHSAKPCAICAKMFYTWVELGQHALSHQQPDGYHCPQCSFICPTYTKLARHVANYHDVRNLTCCPVCNMMFTSRNRLNGHMRNHAEGFQHDCGLCGKSFRTRSTLQYHKRWSHGTQLKEKFRRLKEKAPARDYTAPRKRMRFEEFTYKCEECRFGFMTEGRWLRHKEKFHYDGADVPST